MKDKNPFFSEPTRRRTTKDVVLALKSGVVVSIIGGVRVATAKRILNIIVFGQPIGRALKIILFEKQLKTIFCRKERRVLKKTPSGCHLVMHGLTDGGR